MKPIVYLAGPISGLSYKAAAEDWRVTASQALAPEIDCATPMRGHKHLANETRIKHCYMESPSTTPRGIIRRDHFDVCRSSVLLVNLLGCFELSQITKGTLMELAWAWDRQKPIVVIIEDEGNVHDGHPMVSETFDYRFSELSAGIEQVRDIIATGL